LRADSVQDAVVKAAELNSIAVLPFENEGPDATDEFLGTAMAGT
jgi:TolB-like protein